MTSQSAGAKLRKPKWDITLSDGRRELGFFLSDREGKRTPTGIQRLSFPRQSTRLSSTDNKYSNMEPPYYNTMQDEWAGGRGSENFEEDVTRFFDSYRLWTDHSHQAILGGLETYCTTPKYSHQFMPGNMGWHTLGSGQYARKFTCNYTTTYPQCYFWVKRSDYLSSNSLVCEIWTDSAGSPGSLVAGYTDTIASSVIEYGRSQLVVATFESSIGNLTATTSYWIVIRMSGTSYNNNYQIGVDPDANTDTKYRASGIGAWSASTDGSMYYRVCENQDYNLKFFEYKRCLYAADIRKSGGWVYRNGYRGLADDNGANLDRLVDGVGGWSTDELNGCTVLCTRGAGSKERQPWRVISDTISGPSGYLLVDPPWEYRHGTDTEYVVLGLNKWVAVHQPGISLRITDVAVADEFYYLAFSNGVVERVQEHALATAVWAMESDFEDMTADTLLSINTPSGWTLWGGKSGDALYRTHVWKAMVPPGWVENGTQKLYNELFEVAPTNVEWNEQHYTNNDNTVDSDGNLKIVSQAASGIQQIASIAIPATDLTKAKKIGFMAKSNRAESNLQVLLSDEEYCSRKADGTSFRYWMPSSVFKYDKDVEPAKAFRFRSEGRPTLVHFLDGSTWHKMYNAADYPLEGDMAITLQSTDKLYVSYNMPFKDLAFTINTGNTTVAVLTLKYWNGSSWATLTDTTDFTDNTKSAGKALNTTGWINITGDVTNWEPGCSATEKDYLPEDQFHLEITIASDSTAMDIEGIKCHGLGDTEWPRADQFVPLTGVADSNEYRYYTHKFKVYDRSWLYIGHTKRFNKIKMAFATANSKDMTMDLYQYWDGMEWVTLSTFADGTLASSAHSLGQDGSVTFDKPVAWNPGCRACEQPYLGTDLYVVRVRLNVTEVTTNSRQTGDISLKYLALEDTEVQYDEVFNYETLPNLKDGDMTTNHNLQLDTDDWLYVFGESKFNNMYVTMQYSQTATTDLIAQYFNGSRWVAITLTADGTKNTNRTLYGTGLITWTLPEDWEQLTIEQIKGYPMRFAMEDANSSPMSIILLELARQNFITCTVPPMSADEWHWLECTITSFQGCADLTQIKSIAIYRNDDNTSIANLYLSGGIKAITDQPTRIRVGGAEETIIAMESYGSERENPWVFTDKSIWQIQTENDNAPAQIPLKEIQSLRSELNGQAHTVNGVYLYFNLGSHIEKYYLQNMDDVGPDRDAGMPPERQGVPKCLISYPGRIIAALSDGTGGYTLYDFGRGVASSLTYPIILSRRESGWHEIYRGPYGVSITGIITQVVPGAVDRLWVAQGSDILWLPLPDTTFNPVNDSNYFYTHEGHLITGWISLNFLDIEKVFVKLKLYTENLVSGRATINVEYQLEDGDIDGTWHKVDYIYDESPFDESLLSDEYDVSGRRIRFKIILNGGEKDTPILKSMVLESIMRFPVKYSYSGTIMLEDHKESRTGRDMTRRVEDDTLILDEWADSAVVLTMRCNYSPYDNKRVTLEPSGMQPIPPFIAEDGHEKHLANFTLLEA